MALAHRTPLSTELRPVVTEAELTELSRFSLNGHQLIDPATKRGYVKDVVSLSGADLDSHDIPNGVLVENILVVDPFVEADPGTKQLVDNHIAKLEQALRNEGYDPLAERRKRRAYNDAPSERGRRVNKFTGGWMSSDPGLAAWRSLVPSAMALYHLTDPSQEGTVTDEYGTQVEKTAEFVAQLRMVSDSVGIRDRAVGMEYIATQYLIRAGIGAATILSLASGTAQPVLAAAKNISESAGVEAFLDVTDFDEEVLATVRDNAIKEGFEGNLNVHKIDFRNPRFVSRIRRLTQRRSNTIVENTGFLEYLPEVGDGIGAFKDIPFLPQASVFTRKAMELVDPENGILISGNMVLGRPQQDFVFGVADWPIINARTLDGVLRIYERAGVLKDPSKQLTVHQVINANTREHVYNLMSVAPR